MIDLFLKTGILPCMKTEIAYFTGTGNSLFVAETLSRKIGEAELVPVVAALKSNRAMPEKLGIVCPVYMHRLPHIVADFVKTLDRIRYFFLVGVNAGEIGRAFSVTRGLLKDRDVDFRAGFSVPMPSNYLPFGEAVSGAQRDAVYGSAGEKITAIADIVAREESFFDNEDSFFTTRIFPGALYGMGHRYIRYFGKNFSVDPACNGCGICRQICPVNNIEMTAEKPSWGKACQQCLACLNYCPKNAIQYGKSTAGLARYHHPEVTAARIMGQKGE
jgi:ferredoxin